jgi:hypothetical protein
MIPATRSAVPGVHPDAIAAVVAQAEHDAELVIAYVDRLRRLGILGPSDGLPGKYLIALGQALRLREWEELGIRAHLEAGLPSARNAMIAAIQTLRVPGGDDPTLSLELLRLTIRDFAWHGRLDWNAAVALGPLDDDAALDAVAEFLYRNRHAGATRRP